MQAENVRSGTSTSTRGGKTGEAAGIDLRRRSDDRRAKCSHAVARQQFGSGGDATGEGCARVVGREVYTVAAVELPVDETRDDVRVAVALVTGGGVAGDDDRVRAAGEREDDLWIRTSNCR